MCVCACVRVRAYICMSAYVYLCKYEGKTSGRSSIRVWVRGLWLGIRVRVRATFRVRVRVRF